MKEWTDVYKLFEEIINECFENDKVDEIEGRVEELYNEHKDEPEWELAWRKWNDMLELEEV